MKWVVLESAQPLPQGRHSPKYLICLSRLSDVRLWIRCCEYAGVSTLTWPNTCCMGEAQAYTVHTWPGTPVAAAAATSGMVRNMRKENIKVLKAVAREPRLTAASSTRPMWPTNAARAVFAGVGGRLHECERACIGSGVSNLLQVWQVAEWSMHHGGLAMGSCWAMGTPANAEATSQPVEWQPVERQPVERQPIERQPFERQPVERQPAKWLSGSRAATPATFLQVAMHMPSACLQSCLSWIPLTMHPTHAPVLMALTAGSMSMPHSAGTATAPISASKGDDRPHQRAGAAAAPLLRPWPAAAAAVAQDERHARCRHACCSAAQRVHPLLRHGNVAVVCCRKPAAPCMPWI